MRARSLMRRSRTGEQQHQHHYQHQQAAQCRHAPERERSFLAPRQEQQKLPRGLRPARPARSCVKMVSLSESTTLRRQHAHDGALVAPGENLFRPQRFASVRASPHAGRHAGDARRADGQGAQRAFDAAQGEVGPVGRPVGLQVPALRRVPQQAVQEHQERPRCGVVHTRAGALAGWGRAHAISCCFPSPRAGPCEFEVHDDHLDWPTILENYQRADPRDIERCAPCGAAGLQRKSHGSKHSSGVTAR